MRQFIRNAAVAAMVLAAAGTAFAGGKGGPKSMGFSNHSISSYYHNSHNSFYWGSHSPYGFTFCNRCCYRYGYCGWSSTIYSPSYCCNLYYDPGTGLWYFWCPAQSCYLPVSLWSSYHP
jgi:hypothetical protein